MDAPVESLRFLLNCHRMYHAKFVFPRRVIEQYVNSPVMGFPGSPLSPASDELMDVFGSAGN